VLHRWTSLGPVVLRPGWPAAERVEGLGAVVLELLADGRSEDELRDLVRELGGDAATPDVVAALVALEDRGLAVRRP
jgi:hypothetical protein